MFKRATSYNFIWYCSIFLITNCSKADPSAPSQDDFSITSVETLGGSNNDGGRAVVATIDGGYAVLGFTQSNDGDITGKTNTSFDYWLVKFNTENNIEWQNHYGGSQDDRGSDLIQTSDGGFALIGFSFSADGNVEANAGLQDFWLLKLDANGNIQWQKNFGFSGADSGTSVIETNDNGFLVTGILDVTASGGEGNTSRGTSRHAGGDYWALKLDNSGDLEWSQYFGGNFTDTPEGVVETEDGSYIIAGGSDSQDTDISSNIGSYDFWVIKLSSTGELIWEKSFGGNQIDEARAIVATPDGNFVIAGDTRSADNDVSNNKGGADLWLIKISSDGDLIWEQTIGGSNFDVARDLDLDADGNLLLAGSSRSSDGDVSQNNGQNDAWMLKTDSNGNLIWQATVGGSNIDFAYAITQLNNGSVIAVGDSASNDDDINENKGFSDLLIVRLN